MALVGFRSIALPVAATGPRGHRGVVLRPVVERLLLRTDLEVDQGGGGAGRDRQLHAVRGLRVGQDRRRWHPRDAAGRRVDALQPSARTYRRG